MRKILSILLLIMMAASISAAALDPLTLMSLSLPAALYHDVPEEDVNYLMILPGMIEDYGIRLKDVASGKILDAAQAGVALYLFQEELGRIVSVYPEALPEVIETGDLSYDIYYDDLPVYCYTESKARDYVYDGEIAFAVLPSYDGIFDIVISSGEFRIGKKLYSPTVFRATIHYNEAADFVMIDNGFYPEDFMTGLVEGFTGEADTEGIAAELMDSEFFRAFAFVIFAKEMNMDIMDMISMGFEIEMEQDGIAIPCDLERLAGIADLLGY